MLNIVEAFTVETVMSDESKLEYIRLVKNMGYRIYLYFISTKNVEINIGRVHFHVETSERNIPETIGGCFTQLDGTFRLSECFMYGKEYILDF